MPIDETTPPRAPTLQRDQLALIILAILENAPEGMTPDEIAAEVEKLTAAAREEGAEVRLAPNR